MPFLITRRFEWREITHSAASSKSLIKSSQKKSISRNPPSSSICNSHSDPSIHSNHHFNSLSQSSYRLIVSSKRENRDQTERERERKPLTLSSPLLASSSSKAMSDDERIGGPSAAGDDDLSLPKTTISKIINGKSR